MYNLFTTRHLLFFPPQKQGSNRRIIRNETTRPILLSFTAPPNSRHSFSSNPTKFLHPTRSLHPPTSFFHATFFLLYWGSPRFERHLSPPRSLLPCLPAGKQRGGQWESLPLRASKLNLEMSRHEDTLVSRNWSDRRARRRTRAQKRDCTFATSGDRSEIRLGLAVGEHNDKKTHDAPLSLPSPLRPRVFHLLFSPLAFVYFFLLVISINGGEGGGGIELWNRSCFRSLFRRNFSGKWAIRGWIERGGLWRIRVRDRYDRF